MVVSNMNIMIFLAGLGSLANISGANCGHVGTKRYNCILEDGGLVVVQWSKLVTTLNA